MKLLKSIVIPLLPLEPGLTSEVRTEVEQAVVEFLAAQIQDMPSYLRVPYRIAMIGFDWLAIRQYGRRYVRLDPTKQVDYLSVWIHSTLGVKRDFIKLIRSCALLRFYDHPKVRENMDRRCS